jgi:Protein of unknown function (DUF2809)
MSLPQPQQTATAVSRPKLALLLAVTIAAGLLVRFAPILPAWLRDAGGGALYVICVAVLFRLLAPALSPVGSAWLALGFTFMVEFSQLSRGAWLVSARSTLPGRLVLGSTFSWMDFPPYLFGGALAAKVPRFVRVAISSSAPGASV